MRAARQEKGISQVKLAQEMTARGWPWAQQTVTNIESGQRMIRLGEAMAVSEILGRNVIMLMASTRETAAVTMLATSISRAKSAYGQIAQWTGTLLFAQRQLATSLAEAERAGYHGSDHVREVAAEAAGMLELTPEQATAEGRAETEDLVSSAAEYNEQARIAGAVVRAYVEEGMSIRSITSVVPVSERQVREILREYGVAVRGRRKGDAPATPAADRLTPDPGPEVS